MSTNHIDKRILVIAIVFQNSLEHIASIINEDYLSGFRQHLKVGPFSMITRDSINE